MPALSARIVRSADDARSNTWRIDSPPGNTQSCGVSFQCRDKTGYCTGRSLSGFASSSPTSISIRSLSGVIGRLWYALIASAVFAARCSGLE